MNIAIVCMAVGALGIAANSQAINMDYLRDLIFNRNIQRNNEKCWDTPCNHYSSIIKRNDEFPRIDDVQPIPRDFISTKNPWQWLCPCETQYDIANLGPGNYPRYLAIASCIPKPCHGKFNLCKLIHYKVHILKERELNDDGSTNEEQYIEQPILPESLAVKWQLKPMKVAVACIAAEEGRQN